MSRGALIAAWIVATLAWVAWIAQLGMQGWPHVPMDMSAGDPATRAAFDAAVRAHVVRYALIALAPPILLVLGMAALRRKT